MFFRNNAPLTDITNWVKMQLNAILPSAKNGIDILIRPHQNIRTNEQNRFYRVILGEQVKFYHETGFMVGDTKPWEQRTEILHFYWKDRYGIDTTTKLSTKQFTEYIDFIQATLVEESSGEWEILTTDSAYLKSLMNL